MSFNVCQIKFDYEQSPLEHFFMRTSQYEVTAVHFSPFHCIYSTLRV